MIDRAPLRLARHLPSARAATVAALAALGVVLVGAPARAQTWVGLELEPPSGAPGVRVRHVMPESPAARAGVLDGDVVVAIDAHPMTSVEELQATVRRHGAGDKLKLKLAGAGGARMVTVTLETRPDPDALQRHVLEGHPAPDFEPAVQAGAKLGRLSSLKGQVVVIDFFATWCGPCVAAMPHMQQLHERLGKRGLKVIGVSTESADIVASAAGRFRLGYTLASDEDEEISRRYQVFALPTMVVIDRQGVVRKIAVADTDALDAAVERAMAQK